MSNNKVSQCYSQVYNQVICIIKSLSQYNKSITVQYTQFVIINYVSEHQLSHVIGASHITPTTRVNQDSKLLKSIDENIVHALGGFRTYPEP